MLSGGESGSSLPGVTVEALPSTDEGVAFLVTAEGRTVFHAGDLNWWHWEGEDPVWNRNMEVDFRRYAEPLRGRRIDLAMLPLDPPAGGGRLPGPRYFLELADIRRFLPMHQCREGGFAPVMLPGRLPIDTGSLPVCMWGMVTAFGLANKTGRRVGSLFSSARIRQLPVTSGP